MEMVIVMLASERQRLICERATRDGQVLVNRLSAELGVSAETIRRDIQYLSSVNAIIKVHGGALPINRNQREGAYNIRAQINPAGKDKVGRYAATFVQDNDVIALDSGATIDCLVRSLYGVKNLTIITGSFSTLNILMEKHSSSQLNAKVVFLGGEVNFSNQCSSGGLTNEMLERFSVDKAFISCTSLNESGVKMYDINDGIFTSLIIKRASIVHLLCTSEKLNKQALYQICELSSINHIITDNEGSIPPKVERYIEQSSATLHIAK